MLDWIRQGMTADPRVIVEKMSTTLQGTVAHSIQNFAEKN